MPYIGNPDIKRQISRPPYLGDGPRALDLIRTRCSIEQMQTDWQETKEKWLSITIAKDIGCSPSTIEDLELELDTVNQQLPVNEQFGENDKAVMILKSIANASRHFNYAAKREINAIEGVPGQPRVREFQQAPPGGGGPRLRDCAGIVSNYAGLWRDAVMSGTIPKAQPTSRRAPTRVETGMLLTGIDRPETIFSGVDGASYAPRGVDPQHTLDLIRDAIAAVEEQTETGLSLAVRRSDTTTTDFGAVPPAELQRAVEMLNQGNVDPTQEFVLHQVFDAEGTPSWEISCRCCGGLGHIAKHCASEKKFRSFDHIIKMATDSKERAEARGAERGHPPGGKRGMPRGQRAPYKPFPRNFEQKVGPRRSFSSATRTRPNQARSAEEGYQSEESEAAATVVHGHVSTEEKTEEVKDAKKVVLQREPGRPMPKLFRDDDFFSSEETKVASATDVPAASRPQAPPEDEEQCEECEAPEAEEEAASASDAPAGPRPQAPPGAPRRMGYVGMLGMGLVAGMNVTLLVTLLVLAMAKPAGAMQLSPQGAMRAAPPGWHAPRAASRVYDPPRATFDVIEQVLEIRECDLEFGLDVGLDELPQRDPTGDSSLIYATVDSGATIICISEYDEWMIDGVVDAAPRVGVEVADGVHLTTKTIGTVNSGGPHRGRLGLSAHECTWSADGEPTLMPAGVSYPPLSRVHVVKGLKQGTRLLGVRPLRRDGHQAFFNEDNGAKQEDCLRLKDGRYVLFTNDEKRYEVAFHANQNDESAFTARDSQRSGLEVHASLMHACTRRIKKSLIHIAGFDLTTLDVEGSDCRGCRFGKTPSSRDDERHPATGQAA